MSRLPLLLLLPCLGCPAPPAEAPEPTPEPPPIEPIEPWAWCPDHGELAGVGTGAGRLRITPRALYCGTFDEARSLADEPDHRIQALFLATDLAVPLDPGTYEAEWPVCLRLPDGQAGRSPDGPGTVAVERFETTAGERVLLRYLQPLVSDAGLASVLAVDLSGPLPDDGAVPSLDGAHRGVLDEVGLSVSVCAPDCETGSDIRRLDSCHFDGIDTEQHRVEFEGGWLELDLRIGTSVVSTQPAVFLGGRGALDGTGFEQRDYWRLAYNPTLHHFSRDFGLLFDAPIGGACGLVARDVDPWGDDPPTAIERVDCDFVALDERAVTDESWSPAER